MADERTDRQTDSVVSGNSKSNLAPRLQIHKWGLIIIITFCVIIYSLVQLLFHILYIHVT